MKFYNLLTQAKEFLNHSMENNDRLEDVNVIDFGSKWMFDRMNEIIPNPSRKYDQNINYFGYGLLKYGLSISITILFLIYFYYINVFLLPLIKIVFYTIEVHFLFLFPILLDGKRNPIITSLRYTYRFGIIQLIANVIPIAIYMIFGLIHFKNPFRNWLIGCVAILIWYKDATRDWI